MKDVEMKKKYSREFKKQALELAESLGNYSEAARQLGIGDALIHTWRSKLGNEFGICSSKSSLQNAETEEMKRLRKENAELKKVNYILKAAAAFFSQDQLK